jgi:drug/metabolite transporter (DMT)-like permease
MIFVAFLAAAGVAVCNGVAAILEKLGAGREARATSAHLGLLWRLKGNLPYLLGVALDLLAWALTLVAVHTLPLFVVQPIIAFSVVVTALVDHFIFKNKLVAKTRLAILVIVAGLVLLALVASPEEASDISHNVRWFIILAPLVLAVIGSLFSKVQAAYSTVVLAGTSGVAFGGTSVVGRVINFSHPYWRTLYDPLAWAILGYGLVGILFFTIALQRASATIVNASMIACETLFPILIGLLFFGDHPRHGLWLVATVGIILAFAGTTLIALNPETEQSRT